MKRKVFSIAIVAICVLFAATAFAQALPTGENIVPQAAEVTEEEAEQPPAEPAPPAPEEKPEPAPSDPEDKEEPEKEEPAETPEPAEVPDEQEVEEAENLDKNKPEKDRPEQPEQPEATPEETPEPVYDSPAIFTGKIVAKGSDASLKLTQAQQEEIDSIIPKDLSPYRKEIVQQAYSLVGKVNYFWGGKSMATGWDTRWGNAAIVGSSGSVQTGTTRAYGLDCSGYVLWSMANTEVQTDGSKAGAIGRVGYGTAEQWHNSRAISMSEALPGDIVFYHAPGANNHVGIVVGRNSDGQALVAHCSSSRNNVIISKVEAAGFNHARRLYMVEERDKAAKELTVAKATDATEQLSTQKKPA